ncbi:MAG TPA: Hpt domain-containing protein [Beijerinckia sp.]|nr:Hpt domain-containing protein [Beijerinckia sp.]
MPSIEPKPVFAAEDGGDPILDHAYVARQSLGDLEFECELLILFRNQMDKLLPELRSLGPRSHSAGRDLAHLLRGSAAAIGATRIAKLAAHYESLLIDAAATARHPVAAGAARADLAVAMEATMAAIDTKLAAMEAGAGRALEKNQSI